MNQEKRRAPRIAPAVAVDVCFVADPPTNSTDGTVLDISTLGMRFSSTASLTQGSTLLLKVHFPRDFDRVPLALRARLVRSKKVRGQGHEVACEFRDIQADASRKLKAFVAWLSHGHRATGLAADLA